MAIRKISLKNITVFSGLEMQFSPGINIFVGPNGVGKTHLLKLLYSACRAADPKTSFSHKIVRCFGPDDHRISRLVRRKQGNNDASLSVTNQGADQRNRTISVAFSNKTPKWDAETTGESTWEKQFEELNGIFIPAKEILSHSYNLNAAVEMNNVSFDDTYLDIINAAKIAVSPGKNAAVQQSLLKKIGKIIDGRVVFDEKRDEFYLQRPGGKVEFNLAAEGIRKIALLWQLVKNGILMKGTVLFWDEPEANINPVHIPVLVEMLLELQRSGIQIFISTHDYFLSKYFEVKRTQEDEILFHSFYVDEDSVKTESQKQFRQLEHNAILDTFVQLYEDEIDKVMDE